MLGFFPYWMRNWKFLVLTSYVIRWFHEKKKNPMSKSSPPPTMVLVPQPLKLVQETCWRKKAHDEKPLHLGVVSGYVCLYVCSLCCSGFFFSISTPERHLLRQTNHGSISKIRHFWMYIFFIYLLMTPESPTVRRNLVRGNVFDEQ